MLAKVGVMCVAVSAVSGIRVNRVRSIGSDIGDTIRDNNSESMRDSYQKTVIDNQETVVNPAVEGVVKSANAKASFLKGLNLHVEETGSGANSVISTEMRHDRHQLASLAADEARFQQMYANSMSKSFAQIPSDVQREAGSIAGLTGLGDLVEGVKAGGYTGFGAMATLLEMTAEPNARTAMNANLGLLRALKDTMQRESTSDQARTLAGSILTRVTNLPVASESSDKNSGSFGHVNVVLPSPSRVYGADYENAQLNSGARPMDTTAGDYYSFLKVLPAGVPSGLHNMALGGEDYVIALHPPEEDAKMASDAIDSVLKIEEGMEKAHESDFIAEKQKLLNAELAKVHQLVAARRSFMKVGGLRRTADYSITMHAPEETAGDVRSALRAIRRVEAAKQSSAMADYVADKQRLLNAEIAKIHSLVH